MKRLLLSALITFLGIGCFAQNQLYTIKGTIHDVDLNGERVDLMEFGEDTNFAIQDTRIRNNSFLFSGKIDQPRLWILLIENHKILLVVEKADIIVDIYRDSSKVSGTKINEDFQAFVDKSNAYRKEITELFARYQAAPEDSPEKDSLMKQLEDMEKHWQSKVIVEFVEANINNPAGQRAFKSVLPDLSAEELKRIIAKVDSVSINIPYIQRAIEQVNAAEDTP
ncbi:MAG: DUF4369 domain-containing protein [Prevotellaceae bacterium]|jgi:hypothetical protein|nr:DUF4369 domain-containing protein [Prevotellaceae bacterium]